MHYIIETIKNLPPEIATFVLAMLPVTELRGSIPIALGVFHLDAWLAFLISVIGNYMPAIFLILFLKPIANWLSEHISWFKKLFDWWFNRVIKNFEPKFIKYGPLALMVFVAIPLPITGAWTGAAASFLFNIPKKQSFVFIGLGLIISGIIVSIISTGAFALF